MIKVQVRSNEPLEAALRRFKRQCNYAGIFRLAKKYNFYEKRSDEKRREGRERVRNIQRAERKLQEKVRPRSRRKSKVKAGQQNADGQNAEGQNAEGAQQNAAEAKATENTEPTPNTGINLPVSGSPEGTSES